MKTVFDYQTAFSRNIGWFTEDEQQLLAAKKVAIAGCGGVGGIHTLTLARLGIGQFALSDFDSFGIENFNRQVGALMSTIDKPKLAVISQMLKDINPQVKLSEFAEGVNEHNAEVFLEGVDLYVDSLDFFAIKARRLIFDLCQRKNIPAITAAPLGMGTAFLCFMPGKMSFEQYFGMSHCAESEQFVRFYLGLAPKGLQRQYLVDPSRVDLANKRGPSTIVGCTLSAGIAASYASKILLGRGDVICAPRGMQVDGYRNKLVYSWMPFGAANPWFKLKVKLAKKQLGIN
ncbi:ThiF family adenylyltransferase [Arsukibacterium sp.]|uniref:ThiF family adenylyltransferase n=1 Tax=Arsukibacterium sp. TaxID=1977258 RepID=UPI002FDA689B